jgi:spore coat polysaccharide biosynthesis predicted glycosyltransferase SpsG
LTVRLAFVADGSKAAGLGHLSRSTAIAHALDELAVAVDRYSLGASEAITRDELVWEPLETLDQLAAQAAGSDVVVLDAYELDPIQVGAVAAGTKLAWFHDHGEVPPEAGLAIAPAASQPTARGGLVVLAGLQYAPLGRCFWSPAPRTVGPTFARVLVTMGGTDPGARSAEIAGAARDAAPEAEVVLVRGPHSPPVQAPPGVTAIGPLPGLADELVAADLVVGAAGQTMLEAAALGTPGLFAVAAANQLAGAGDLECRGAVELFDLADPRDLAARITALAADPERRRKMSAAGQEAVDGGGARRIARALVALAAGDR